MSKKNILIISIYYPPIASIASNRIESFAKYLDKEKYNVFVHTLDSKEEYILDKVKVSRVDNNALLQPLLFTKRTNKFLHYSKVIYNKLLKYFFKNDTKLIEYVDKNKVIEQMKIYKDFPLVNSFHILSDVAKRSLSVILILTYFSSTVLGFYALSLRVLQTPLGIIGSSFGQVLYQRFNTAKDHDESIYEIAKSVIIKLMLFALPIFITLYFIAPELFAFVFGEKWRVAGVYTQMLTPYLFMNFLISPISQIPIILNKQKKSFYLSLLGNILFILIIILFHNDIKEMFILMSMLMSIFNLFLLFWYLKIAYKDKNDIQINKESS